MKLVKTVRMMAIDAIVKGTKSRQIKTVEIADHRSRGPQEAGGAEAGGGGGLGVVELSLNGLRLRTKGSRSLWTTLPGTMKVLQSDGSNIKSCRLRCR